MFVVGYVKLLLRLSNSSSLKKKTDNVYYVVGSDIRGCKIGNLHLMYKL